MAICDEPVTVNRYERMTPLTVMNAPLKSFNNVQPGDCIVCFGKHTIYQVARQVQKFN